MGLLCKKLEESSNFATTRHESKAVLHDVISVTASMQTQETEWNDSDQAWIRTECEGKRMRDHASLCRL